ncbi:hypothetical protein [Thauera aromatica]|uniref:hypothetical protein n=1 Tax=Thauera aromatica TaxID=59405 RepID=UPI001FE579E8|nr:hypothetical protein [Thauera aromatica]
MRLLLSTHFAFWWQTGDPRITEEIRALVESDHAQAVRRRNTGDDEADHGGVSADEHNPDLIRAQAVGWTFNCKICHTASVAT